MYPVSLSVSGRRVLVVGGGGVALRKVEGLVSESACVSVVAETPVDALARLADDEVIALAVRSYQPGEVAGFSLVVAATDDREVNRRVFQDAEAAGIWVNVADDPELCTFHLPARVNRGKLQLAISSGGDAPFVVRRLRQFLEQRFGPEWGEWMDAAARFRNQVRDARLSGAAQEIAYDTFFRESVDPEKTRARVPLGPELQAWIERGAAVDGVKHVQRHASRRVQAGTDCSAGLVSLVGAGPGDPGLLTLKGHARLHAADAVVYDRLAATALPCDLSPRIELHCVGKTAGHHPVPQEEINALLIRLANDGKRVVRLKGGDPYVFGRGGEEAQALVDAGIAFEVVPAVTAGIAAPAYAGIPVTQRREAVRVTMVTAHEALKADGPQVDWELMARDPHATIVGYMGVTSLPKVVERLLAAGMSPETPAALIERGTTAAQRTAKAPLRDLVNAVEANGIKPPGLFIIGPTAGSHDELDWFTSRPLFGQRIILPSSAAAIREVLEISGADVIVVPLPLTPAARVVAGAIPITGCLLSSASEVDALDEERDGPGWENVTAWCSSADVAERARELGWPDVLRVDVGHCANHLIDEILEHQKG